MVLVFYTSIFFGIGGFIGIFVSFRGDDLGSVVVAWCFALGP